MDLIISREGYFLIRTIIKAIKDDDLQMAIVNTVKDNFQRMIKTSNGSLLIQCMIHNFPCVSFTYFRSCSQHIEKNISSKETAPIKDYNNKAVNQLMIVIFKNVDLWDVKLAYPIIDCLLRVGNSALVSTFMKFYDQINLKGKYFLDRLLALNNGNEYMTKIFKLLSNSEINYLKNYIKHNDLNRKKELLNWLFEHENLLKQDYCNKSSSSNSEAEVVERRENVN